jgi:NADH-quinone oxidoreductase subunit H
LSALDPNANLLVVAGRVALMWLAPLLLLPLMIWFERKGSAFMQDRTGPNRASIAGIRLGGIVHTIADVLKMLGKEHVVPLAVDKRYFLAAPVIAILVPQLLFVVIPFADSIPLQGREVALQALRLDIGILYPLAIGSTFVYAVVLAGWSSNNKYGILGGLRASAQMVSYEVALGLSIVGALMVYGTVDLNEMVRQQGELLGGWLPQWGVVVQPLGALLFVAAAFAEASRTPFDLPERDAEIVGGYHTEYSGMRLACFLMAEYVHVVVASGLVVTLYFGGWQIPWLPTEALRDHAGTVLDVMLAGLVVVGFGAAALALRWSRALRVVYRDARRHEGRVLAVVFGAVGLAGVGLFAALHGRALPDWAPLAIAATAQFSAFMAKTILAAFGFIWVRWTLPSFRYDQLMRLGWKNLMPLALANIGITGIVLLLVDRGGR